MLLLHQSVSKKIMNLENAGKIALVFLKWISISILIGIASGSASAFFLVTLDWVTSYREENSWIIWLLPFGGLLIGFAYYFSEQSVVKGTNLLLEEYSKPQKTIPLLMAPLVLFGTLITHLFGGSAGREGTAVQMGGAIADQLTSIFKLEASARKTILILGISAGFASIFGTPLAGALFALELVFFSTISLRSIPLSFLTAYIAHFTVAFWNVEHTYYSAPILPEISFTTLFWILPVSILFGLVALLFSRNTHFWGHLFSKNISYPPLRPFVGGIALAIAIFCIGTTKYIGLGIPVIVDSFSNPNAAYDFLLKILFTGFTLGAGFKGGEVTPLFFVGATLGSALSTVIPLPIALLAAMGFVAVFAGATHTPIACTVMGMEIFGLDSGIFIGAACCIAYFASGPVGIYSAQIVKGPKYHLYRKLKLIS